MHLYSPSRRHLLYVSRARAFSLSLSFSLVYHIIISFCAWWCNAGPFAAMEDAGGIWERQQGCLCLRACVDNANESSRTLG